MVFSLHHNLTDCTMDDSNVLKMNKKIKVTLISLHKDQLHILVQNTVLYKYIFYKFIFCIKYYEISMTKQNIWCINTLHSNLLVNFSNKFKETTSNTELNMKY